MERRRRGGGVVIIVLSTAALLLGAAAIVLPRVGSADPATVTVMTRNVYLGADLSRPARAAGRQTGPNGLAALGRATDATRAMVDRTDFRVRSRLLAAEIAAARPELVGLQEVALWRSGPLELGSIGVPNATEVDGDFLDLLLTELGRTPVAYDVVMVQEESDVEAPAFPDPRQQTGRTGRDVRLTLRDVILVRADAGVTVRGRGGGQFSARFGVDLAGAAFEYVRGFAWADVESGGTRFRFLTTHLEAQDPEVARAQAAELLAGPAADAGQPVVVVGDLNAAADPPDPAYAVLTDGGLIDAWPAGAGPGYTFGLGETVTDDVPGFERRIDHVLARGLPVTRPDQGFGELTGDEPGDRDPATGLWPSDHAGVVVRLALG